MSGARLLTCQEAADRLGLTRSTVWRWIEQRKLGSVKFGSSNRAAVRVLESEVERLIQAHLRPALVAMPGRRKLVTKPESAA